MIHFHTHQSQQVAVPPASEREAEATRLFFLNFSLLSLCKIICDSFFFLSSDQVGGNVAFWNRECGRFKRRNTETGFRSTEFEVTFGISREMLGGQFDT